MKTKFTRLDANESVFFGRQLQHVKAKTYDVKYADLKARSLIPVSFEAGAGAESIKYEQFDQYGIAKIISNYADDLPRADVSGKEFVSPIKSLGSSYGYNIQEVRAAMMKGMPLAQRKANAAKRAIMQKENKIAFFGDANSGLPGLLSNSNIPSASVLNDGTAGATTFASKTPDQILRDMNECVNDVVVNSKGVEIPDTLLMPIEQFTYISSTPRSSTSDTTILEYFLQNNPFIQQVDWVNELKGAGPGGVDVMMAYRRSPDVLTLEIPQDFEQLDPEEKGLEITVACHARCGGVIVYYPLAINIAEGI